MDLATLKAELQDLGYGTDTDTVQGRRINAAYRRLCRRRAWWFLRSSTTVVMTPGTHEYTWTNFGINADPPRRLESARLIDTTVTPNDVIPLKWLSPMEYADVRGDPAIVWPASERDTPTWWTRTTTGVGVWSPPDLAYKLHVNYFAPAATLVGATEPLIPRDYQDVIVWEAAYEMATRQRDQIMIAEARNERDAILAQLEAEDNSAQLHDYERIGGKDIWADMELR